MNNRNVRKSKRIEQKLEREPELTNKTMLERAVIRKKKLQEMLYKQKPLQATQVDMTQIEEYVNQAQDEYNLQIDDSIQELRINPEQRDQLERVDVLLDQLERIEQQQQQIQVALRNNELTGVELDQKYIERHFKNFIIIQQINMEDYNQNQLDTLLQRERKLILPSDTGNVVNVDDLLGEQIQNRNIFVDYIDEFRQDFMDPIIRLNTILDNLPAFEIDTSIDMVYNKYVKLAELFVEWENQIVDRELMDDSLLVGRLNYNVNGLNAQMTGTFYCGQNEERKQQQFITNVNSLQPNSEQLIINNRIYDRIKNTHCWQRLTGIQQQNALQLRIDLDKYLVFRQRFVRLMHQDNSQPIFDGIEFDSDLDYHGLRSVDNVQHLRLYLKGQGLERVSIWESMGMDRGSFVRTFLFLTTLISKDANLIRPTGWGFFASGEVDFFEENVIIEGQQYDGFAIQRDMTEYNEFLGIDVLQISMILLWNAARFSREINNSLKLIRWHQFESRYNVKDSIDNYIRRQNYGEFQLPEVQNQKIDNNDVGTISHFMLTTGEIRNIGTYRQLHGQSAFKCLNGNLKILADEIHSYIIRLEEIHARKKIRIDLRFNLQKIDENNWEKTHKIVDRLSKKRYKSDAQSEYINNMKREIEKNKEQITDIRKYQRVVGGFRIGMLTYEQIIRSGNADIVYKLICKVIGFQGDYGDEQIDYDLDDEDVVYHNSGFTEEDFDDFKKIIDEESLEYEFSRASTILSLIERLSQSVSLQVERAMISVYDDSIMGFSNVVSISNKAIFDNKSLGTNILELKTPNYYVYQKAVNDLRFDERSQFREDVRHCVHPTMRTIEYLFDSYNCVQHVVIFLMIQAELIDEVLDDYEVARVVECFNQWPQFQALYYNDMTIYDFLEHAYHHKGMFSSGMYIAGLDILTLIKVNERNFVTFKGQIRINKEQDWFLLAYYNHLTVVRSNVATDLDNLCQKDRVYNEIIEYEQQLKAKQQKRNDGKGFAEWCQGVPYNRKNTQSLNQLIQDYSNVKSEDQLQKFYNEYSKDNFRFVCNNDIFVFYDIETTTSCNIKVGYHHKMEPYIVSYYVYTTSTEESLGSLVNGSKNTFTGFLCIQRFLGFINEQCLRRRPLDKRKIILVAWNGRKFDSQFLIKYFYKNYPRSTNLIGTISNPKQFNSISDQVHFWDSMDMVSPMKLESFCKSMGIQGKDLENGKLMWKIQSLDDWYKMIINNQDDAFKLIKYCEQDVEAMKNAILKFNQHFIDLVCSYRGIEKPSTEIFILEKTMAKLSYNLFSKYLMPSVLEPKPIMTMEIYDAVTQSYRGGFVQSFIFGEIDIFGKDCGYLQYIDVNSLYPSVMANSNIPLQMFDRVRNYYNGEQIVEQNLYCLEEFNLGRNGVFGFFGVRVFEKNKFKKVIYPQSWRSNINQKQIWCWGSEILCCQRCIPGCEFKITKVVDCILKGKMFAPIGLTYQKRMEIKNSNPSLANAIKLFMNSLYGRYGMKAYEVSYIYPEKLYQLFEKDAVDAQIQLQLRKRLENVMDGNRVHKQRRIVMCDDDLLNVKVVEQGTYMPVSKVQRLKHVASFISSQSRCRLLATIYQLQSETEAKILYCDTDSVVYSLPSENCQNRVECLIPWVWGKEDSSSSCVQFGNGLGQMKKEIDDDQRMIQFQTFGAKFYRYRIQDKRTGKISWINKSKGISSNVKTCIDEELNEYINQRRQELFFDQFSKQLSSKTLQVQIRSKEGNIYVVPLIKQNKYCYTRMLVLDNRFHSSLYSNSVCYYDIDEYLKKKNKNIEINYSFNQYIVRD